MESSKEILDTFGKLIVQEVFDNQFRFILNKVEDLSATKEYENLFSTMNKVQKVEMENYTKEILEGTLFDFLRLFEENDQFKIIFKNSNQQQIDLNKISEVLKSEPIIENGWIDRFSKEIDNQSTP